MKAKLMKTSFRALAVLALMAFAPLPLAAHEQAGEGDEDGAIHDGPEVDAAVNMLVQVQVEFIDLPHTNLTELLATHTPGKSRELRERVQKLVKAGTAKIIETQVVTGRSAEKLESQAVQELIYPTEYRMWDMLQHPPGGGLGAVVSPPQPIPAEAPFIPTSFETRNIGSTLTVEPTLSADGSVIDMKLDPELTWYTGDSIWMELKDTRGNACRIQMPEIYTLKLHTAMSMRAGSTLFIAALSPKDASGDADLSRKVMVFVKTDVVPME